MRSGSARPARPASVVLLAACAFIGCRCGDGEPSSLRVSTDTGATFASVDVPRPVLDACVAGRAILTAGDGVHRSDDEGRSWSRACDCPGADRLSVSGDRVLALALGMQALWVSTDSGRSFVPRALPPGSARVTGVAGAGSAIFAAGEPGLLARSDDDGRTWQVETELDRGPSSSPRYAGAHTRLAAPHAIDASRVFVPAAGGALVWTDDGGARWHDVSVGSADVLAVWVGARPDELYAIDTRAVVHLGRAGRWSEHSPAGPIAGLEAVWAASAGSVFAVSSERQLLVTHDAGRRWRQVLDLRGPHATTGLHGGGSLVVVAGTRGGRAVGLAPR